MGQTVHHGTALLRHRRELAPWRRCDRHRAGRARRPARTASATPYHRRDQAPADASVLRDSLLKVPTLTATCLRFRDLQRHHDGVLTSSAYRPAEDRGLWLSVLVCAACAGLVVASVLWLAMMCPIRLDHSAITSRIASGRQDRLGRTEALPVDVMVSDDALRCEQVTVPRSPSRLPRPMLSAAHRRMVGSLR